MPARPLLRAIALAALAVAPSLLALVVWPDALLALTFDDSFYYYELAQNLAAGLGTTFDRMGQTNGYHPLWLWVCAAAYALGASGEGAARLLVGVSIGMWAVAFGILARTADRAVSTVPAPARAPAALLPVVTGAVGWLIAANPFVVRTFGGGMESALNAVFYSAVLLIASAAPHPLDLPRAQRLTVGALLAFAFLARTDGALMVAALGLWVAPEAFRRGRSGVLAAVDLCLPATLTCLMFLVGNHLTYGAAMQVSGTLKRVPLTPLRVLWAAACVAAPVFAAYRLARPAPSRFRRLRPFLARTAWMPIFLGVILGYYTGLQTFARMWYFGPIVAWVLLVAMIAAADLIEMALEDAPAKAPGAATWPLLALLGVPLVGGLLVQTQRMADPLFIAPVAANREAARWIAANMPPDAVLASWDSGVLGYYAPQRVVNLDGVVNTSSYADAMRSGTTAAWLADRGISYVVNHDEVTNGEASMRADAEAVLGPDVASGWRLVRTWPFAFRGSLNEVGSSDELAMAVYLFGFDPIGRAPPDPAAVTAP